MSSKLVVTPKGYTPKSTPSLIESKKSPTKTKDTSFRSPSNNGRKKKDNESQSSQSQIHEPASKTESSRILKDQSHLGNDSLLCSNIAADPITSFSINMTMNDEDKDGLASNPEKYCKKLLEENSALKKELEEKNNLVEKLIKENGVIRNEMEQFLMTVNDAREYIDLELKECNQRIQDLEAEIRDLRAENKVYKEQLVQFEQQKMVPATKRTEDKEDKEAVGNVDKDVHGFYSIAQKEMEEFYSKLNGQIASFMDYSKKQVQEFNQNIQEKIKDVKVSSTARGDMSPSNLSVRRNESPLRPRKSQPKAPTILSETHRNSVPMTPGSGRKILSAKKSLERLGNNLDDGPRLLDSGIGNPRFGNASTTFEPNMPIQEENLGSISHDYGRSKRGSKNLISPKASVIKPKLKSDMILQEMKKKI